MEVEGLVEMTELHKSIGGNGKGSQRWGSGERDQEYNRGQQRPDEGGKGVPRKKKVRKQKYENSREASRILSNSYNQEEQENRNDITDPYPDIEIDDLDPVQGYSHDYFNNLESDARVLSGRQPANSQKNDSRGQAPSRYAEAEHSDNHKISNEEQELPSPRPIPNVIHIFYR
jgi:hypothetical protein